MSEEEAIPPSPYPKVSWFPGHIAKAQRELAERLQVIDFVLELADARLPVSSRFERTSEIVGNKPRIVVLTKADLAEPSRTRAWLRALQEAGQPAVAIDARSGEGMQSLKRELDLQHATISARMKARGRLPRASRIMVLGLPNVGKSSLINKLTRTGRAKTGDKPGVTRTASWIRVSKEIELLDTPGILPPRLDDPLVAIKLVMIGGVGSESYDPLEVARFAMQFMHELAPACVAPFGEPPALAQFGRVRGALKAGDEVDMERAARTFLNEVRTGGLGRWTLDWPPGPLPGGAS